MTDLGVGAKLRAAFELSPTILAVTALDDGRLIEVNDAFLRTTGYTRDAIVHNAVLDPGTNFLPKPFGIEQLETTRPRLQ